MYSGSGINIQEGNTMILKGRIFWNGPGWYASRVEGDSDMEVVMPLETAGNDKLPSQSGMMEATQKGLGSPFWLDESPEGFEVK